ncbi:hypothetical protein llap_17784 [Limosa lapponica baueri]|uniref:Uncharacterized protein n=1 Tax=Limosa lapponica baueri TaxID=1758121 RepID=A0A2I0TDQ8_LIMLA|nr:hypothetical protein llap_17784 [Limosa lapponica baueri]
MQTPGSGELLFAGIDLVLLYHVPSQPWSHLKPDLLLMALSQTVVGKAQTFGRTARTGHRHSRNESDGDKGGLDVTL